MDEIKSVLGRCDQSHLLKFFDNLDEQQQAEFLEEIRKTNLDELIDIFKTQVQTQLDNDGKLKPTVKIEEAKLEPIPQASIEGTKRNTDDIINKYRSIGMTEIAQGRVAALVMAGGQGTRLGFNYPKGMYNIGPEPNNSLFKLQANRILKLMKDCESKKPIIWYVMTSSSNTATTKKFFSDNHNFGLNSEEIIFFEQNNIPSFSLDGKILLDEQGKLAKSPNGNGGLFEVLHEQGIVKDMLQRGIEHVHVHSVDNVLVRVCDPVYIGYCKSKNAEAGAKVVEKVDPNEAVGIICKYDGKYKVIEYTEMPEHLASLRDQETGKLVYCAGNICDQYFNVKFLDSIKNQPLDYHIAIKKIPYIDLKTGERFKPTEPNGIKLEKFIFDVFKLTDKLVVWEVSRDDEFSPLKNGPGSKKDNPETALAALQRAYTLGLLSN